MPDTSLTVKITDLHVTLGSRSILRGVSTNIHSGESLAILGANGSGKTTLVRAILGIVPPSLGDIEIFGANVKQRSTVPWDRIGYVPQRVSASSGVPATAIEVVRSGLLGAGHLWADLGPRAKKKAMEALDAVGLADRAHDHVQVFSGGQAQRVLIARALVRNPDLLILDEPLAGIDHDSRESLARILTELQTQGKTLVTVLHEMGELAEVIQRAVVIEDGVIIHDGAPPAPEQGHDHHHHDHQHPHESPQPTAHHAPSLRLEPR